MKYIKLFKIFEENSEQDAGKFMENIFTTAKTLGLTKYDIKDINQAEKDFTQRWKKEGFPKDSNGALGVAKIGEGQGAYLLIMVEDKTKLEKIEDVIENTKGKFKLNDFTNKALIYSVKNTAGDKEAWLHVFSIELI